MKHIISFFLLTISFTCFAYECENSDTDSPKNNYYEINGSVLTALYNDDIQKETSCIEMDFLNGNYSLVIESYDSNKINFYQDTGLIISDENKKFWSNQNNYFSSEDEANRGNCAGSLIDFGVALKEWIDHMNSRPNESCDRGCWLVMGNTLWDRVAELARYVMLCIAGP